MRDTMKLELKGVAHNNFVPKPSAFNGKVPDIVAYDATNELYYLGEAELCESVATDQTKEQLLAWNKVSMSSGKSKGALVPIYFITPNACINKVNKVIADLGLTNRVVAMNT